MRSVPGNVADRRLPLGLDSTLRAGTTTCCYYGTIHNDATLLLAQSCANRGQRAFVGKVCMDRNGGPTYQEESAEASLADTCSYVAAFKQLGLGPLVQPILTPRFAICCTDSLLKGLGDMMSADPTLPLQT